MLEYHPEPLNQWSLVGHLQSGKAYHAVLSVGSQQLPCLSTGRSFEQIKDLMIIVTHPILAMVHRYHHVVDKDDMTHSLIIM